MSNGIFIYDNRLDSNFLNGLYENDIAYAAVIFEKFLNSCKQQCDEIERSFIAGDLQLLKQKIHKMKLTFSFVGLTQLTEKADQLEKNCTLNNEAENIKLLYSDFANTLKLMIPVIEAEYKRLKS